MRQKMTPAERAKQFMPFAALRGYEDALRKRERVVVPRAELSEEAGEELDRRLSRLSVKDMVTVTYFKDGEYLKITGMLSRIDVTAKVLKVVTTKIPFADIYEIVSEESEN